MTEPSREPSPLSALSPLPEPWPLPAGYPRHDPDPDQLRTALDAVAAREDWPSLSWTGLLEGLLLVGRTDIGLGRLVEGHVDALRILDQARRAPRPGARYGVWASRSAGTGIAAAPDGDALRLDGTLRFASGAGVLDRALVPVWLDADTSLLVDLAVDGLPVDRSHWQTAAMRVSQTHTVGFADVVVSRADVIGDPSFYLERPAFLPGGVGVAAVWVGGLARVTDVVTASLRGRTPTPAQSLRLGRVRLALVAAATTLRAAGHRLDELLADPTRRSTVTELCAETRAVVAAAVVAALADVRAVAGPAGLAFDPDLGHAVDDLGLYVAQLNGDAEAARLGAGLVDGP